MLHESLKMVLDEARDHMDKSVEHLRSDLRSIRAGRASPAMLENVKVDYYGTHTPLAQMASISAPQPDMIMVQPWDRSVLNAVEKAIQAANLGLNPSNDGNFIRLPVPPLSEERRRDLVRGAKTRGEDAKIAIRNVRRHSKDHIKDMTKEEGLSEDMRFEAEDDLQKMTDDYIRKVDSLLEHKEAEIMEV